MSCQRSCALECCGIEAAAEKELLTAEDVLELRRVQSIQTRSVESLIDGGEDCDAVLAVQGTRRVGRVESIVQGREITLLDRLRWRERRGQHGIDDVYHTVAGAQIRRRHVGGVEAVHDLHTRAIAHHVQGDTDVTGEKIKGAVGQEGGEDGGAVCEVGGGICAVHDVVENDIGEVCKFEKQF